MSRDYILALAIGSVGIALLVAAVAINAGKGSAPKQAQASSNQATPAPPARPKTQAPQPTPPQAAPTPPPKPAPAPQPKAQPKHAGPPPCLGAMKNGYVMLLDYAEPTPGRFDKPKPGHRLVAAKVRIATNSTARKRMGSNAMYFKVRGRDGIARDAELVGAESLPRLDATDVDPGDFVVGWVTFHVPTQTPSATLQLRYEMPFSGRTPWLTLGEALDKGTKCRAALKAINDANP